MAIIVEFPIAAFGAAEKRMGIARARGNAKRTGRIRDNRGRHTREGDLDGPCKTVERIDGEADLRTRCSLLQVDGILGKSDGEIGLRRR
jgi:hypothetical protein